MNFIKTTFLFCQTDYEKNYLVINKIYNTNIFNKDDKIY
jgi:hypothetical protein